MRKLCEIKGEDGLKVLAEIIDPATEIFADEEIKDALKKSKEYSKAIKIILKNHSKAIITILAALDGVNIEEYQPSMLELPARLIELFNDPDLQKLF